MPDICTFGTFVLQALGSVHSLFNLNSIFFFDIFLIYFVMLHLGTQVFISLL